MATGPAAEPVDMEAGSTVTRNDETNRPEASGEKTLRRDGGGYGQASPEHLPEGFVIDNRFEIRRKLGQGGFGAVYLALDRKLDVEKALKVLPVLMAEDPEALADLRDECRTLILLNHPLIVRVFGFHDEGQLKYIDMEYVPGKSLAQLKFEAEGRKVPENDVIRYGSDVCRALRHAHSKRIIHRDIKPQNIILTPDGEVKVMDFGIAESIRTTASRVARSSSSGTELYMSPEQLRGQDVGTESDLYALAATMYELLSGKPPFYKGNISYQILNEEPDRIEGVSDWLNDVLLRSLEKDYHDRYRSAAELRSDLETRTFTGRDGASGRTIITRAVDGNDAEGSPPSDGNTHSAGVPPEDDVGRNGRKSESGIKDIDLDRTADPAGRSKVPRGTLAVVLGIASLALFTWGAITIILAPRMIIIPDVRGMSFSTANSLLGDNGLVVNRVIEVKTKSDRDSTVKSIRPAPGSEVRKGSPVEVDMYRLWVKVPAVSGLVPDQAAAAVEGAGLTAATSRSEYHPSVQSGTVIGIEDGPSELRAGSAVTLLVSKGIHMIEVPQLAGKTFDEVKRILAYTGFIVGKVDRKLSRGEEKPGIVLTSSPSSGESPEGSAVSLVVSLAGTSVPDVSGLDVEVAKERLSSSGLKPGKQETRYSESISRGKVIDTSPSASSWVEKGSSIGLVVSGFPENYRNSVGALMVMIKSGTFSMGSPSSEPDRYDDERQHTVRITKPFYMAATEVTQAQWRVVMGGNPSRFSNCGEDCPVERVSWLDAVKYCNNLSEKEGLTSAYKINGESVTWTRSADGYRLPTEAEWEYACRAGTTTRFNIGSSDSDLSRAGWYSGNSSHKTHEVAGKKPNAWGLNDMHGNVWEWCWDWYVKDYPGGSVTDPVAPAGGSTRVFRGGGWYSLAGYCRSAYRSGSSPGNSRDYLGFRLVRSAS